MLDATDKKILDLLQINARLSYAEIGRQVALSTPAVIDRVQKLEEQGIITGYQAMINWGKVGYGIRVIVRLKTTPKYYPHIREFAAQHPSILRCDHVTGADSFIMEVILKEPAALEPFIEALHPYGETASAIVMSQYETQHPIQLPD